MLFPFWIPEKYFAHALCDSYRIDADTSVAVYVDCDRIWHFFKFSIPCFLAANHFLLFKQKVYIILNTYIYHQLSPTCFDICYAIFWEIIVFLAQKLHVFVMLYIAALLLSSLYWVFLYLLINFACWASIILKLSTPCLLVVNHFLVLQLNAYMLNTFIYHQVPPICFGVCYTKKHSFWASMVSPLMVKRISKRVRGNWWQNVCT